MSKFTLFHIFHFYGCRLTLATGALVIMMAAGCATPEARIRRNPQMYASLSPAVQEKVEEGRIGIGFSKNAVFLALGQPDRTYTRTTGEDVEKTLIWSYVRTYPAYDRTWAPYYRHRIFLTTGIGNRWYDSALTHGFYHDYVEQEYEYLRVEFKDDEVVAIERLAED